MHRFSTKNERLKDNTFFLKCLIFVWVKRKHQVFLLEDAIINAFPFLLYRVLFNFFLSNLCFFSFFLITFLILLPFLSGFLLVLCALVIHNIIAFFLHPN